MEDRRGPGAGRTAMDPRPRRPTPGTIGRYLTGTGRLTSESNGARLLGQQMGCAIRGPGREKEFDFEVQSHVARGPDHRPGDGKPADRAAASPGLRGHGGA